MSNAVHEAGSPLAEYLEEDGPVGDRSDKVPAGDTDSPYAGSQRQNTLIEDKEEDPPARSPGRPTPRRALSSDRFSEQFKYLICSSPLLEKDYIPGHRASSVHQNEEDEVDFQGGEPPANSPGRIDVLRSSYPAWINRARERWDISLAALGLVYGLKALLGWLPIMLVTLASVAILYAQTRRPQHRPPIVSSPTSSTSAQPPSPLSDPRYATIEHIRRLIECSRNLDDTVEISLSRLNKQPGNTSHLYPLRLSLNSLIINLVDHLATATSTLLEMTDKDELKVLGDMYDVQYTTVGRPGRRITMSNVDLDSNDATIPEPRETRLSLTVSTPQASRSATPMTMSQSYPPHRLSGDFNDPEDRFTQMPSRTPRTVKRSNRDIPWTPHRSPLSGSSSDTSPHGPSRVALSPTYTPDDKRRSLQQVPYDLPVALAEQSAGRDIHGTRPASASQSPFKNNHREPITPSTKRRSLQNMPYNPPSLVDEGRGADLTRTRSAPFSDIQTLRSKYATGGHSRASSLLPPAQLSDGGFSSAPRLTPRIQRVNSVSPLTLPSLKAAYFDVHLRRRRVACCLLGLRFETMDRAYWDDVVKAIQTLQERLDEERQKLDVTLGEVTSDLPDGLLSDVRPPWAAQIDDREFDFAPRTSDAQALGERIEGIQNTLNRAWADLMLAKRALGTEDSTELEKAWKVIREDVGGIVRDWEKGREFIKRMTSPKPSTATDSMSEDTLGDALSDHQSSEPPSFIKTWLGDSEDRSLGAPELGAPIALVRPDPGDFHPEEHDADVPMGREQVWEADVGDVPAREKSCLSREERIKMTRSAREAGLSLKDYLERERDREGFDRREKERETFVQGGKVVDELRGVMDVLRARKAGNGAGAS